ncbi:transcriptional regulator [Aeromonas salmonicida]|uniref:winged helix-turn-helix domain-containing protein n=1 Tax=Aeromonas salmonicida TaxID=645 RepID=UPI0010255792|nr:helix-turn-helix domain-containing protein [Aeromonas salmonicida]VFB09625.1 transcriptional regulator [Aeromonas salmonicida]
MEQTSRVAIYFDCISGRVYSGTIDIGRLNYSERLVFELLIKEKNNVVPKDALLSAGWPGRVVVTNSLNIAIKNIRSALERAGVHNEPETIPKMGYRLSVDVIVISSDSSMINEEKPTIITNNNPTPVTATLSPPDEHSPAVMELRETVDIKKIMQRRFFDFSSEAIALVYQRIYLAYVSFVLFLSLFLYFARVFSEPEIHCIEYHNLTFCGSHIIAKNDIPSEFFLGESDGTYWFSERDDEYIFFKAN